MEAVKKKPRKSSTSPTARTLALFRELGYEVGVVERYNSFTKTRHDLFGCIDLVACRSPSVVFTKPSNGVYLPGACLPSGERAETIGLQACSGTDHAKRLAKAKAEPRLRTWLAAGNRFAVISWSKTGKAGKRKTWTHRRQDLRLEDLS